MRRVTSVLQAVFGSPIIYGSPDDMKFWLERGTAVHKATELWDLGDLDESDLDVRIVGRLAAWKAFRREVGGKIVGIEVEVKNVGLNYAGRLDRVINNCAMFPKETVVLDVKSGQPAPVAALQTMGYALAYMDGRYRRRFPRRMAVELRDTGRYQVEVHDEDESDQSAWEACLKVHNWKERNKIL